MPTLVIDWEWSAPFSLVNVPDKYSHALILVRCFDVPVEQLRLPVHDRRISAVSIETAISHHASRLRDQIMVEAMFQRRGCSECRSTC